MKRDAAPLLAGAVVVLLVPLTWCVCRVLDGIAAHRNAQAASVLHHAGLLDEEIA